VSDYSGASPDVQLQACINAAIAYVGGICDARAWTGPISGFVNEVAAGNSSGGFGALLLPDAGSWQWVLTGGTQWMMTVYSNFAVIGTSAQNSFQLLNNSATGGAAGGVRTLDVVSASNGNYFYLGGFNVKNGSLGTSSVAYAGGINCLFQGGDDGSYYYNINCLDPSSGDTANIQIVASTTPQGDHGPCCGATFQNVAANSAGTGPTALDIEGSNSAGNPNGFVIQGGSFGHPKPGAYNVLCHDSSATNSTSPTFSGVLYLEANLTTDTTTDMIHIDGCGTVNFGTIEAKAEVASTTKAVIHITNTFNSAVTVQNGFAINGGGGWTFPLAAIINDNYANNTTRQTWAAVSLGYTYNSTQLATIENLSSGLKLLSYSTTPTINLNYGTTQQFSCTTAGASITPSFYAGAVTAGREFNIIFVQNGTTPCTWIWPSTIHGASAVNPALNSITSEKFIVSSGGTDAYAVTSAVGAGSLTFTLPLASSSTINSVGSASGASYTATCTSAGCGLTNGEVINIGSGPANFPSTCQGPANVGTISGNTAVITLTTSGYTGAACVSAATGGPYTSTLGQYINIINWSNPVWASNMSAYVFIDSDGAQKYASIIGTGASRLNLDPGNELVDLENTAGSFNTALILNSGGNLCFDTQSRAETACQGLSFEANTTLYPFLWQTYGKVTSAEPATFGGANSDGNGSDGMPFIVRQFRPSQTITGNLAITTMYTTPSSGYGINAQYRVTGHVICSANCSTGTAYVTVTYTDAVTGASSFYTCGSATNLYAVCTSAPGTPWPFSTSAKFPFSFEVFSGASDNISITITTTNSPSYYLAWTVEVL
jgi:hypothetical protein